MTSSIVREGVPYRPEIDGLRAVAVLGVLLFHLGAAGLPGGYLGVDVFFVISGYLVTSQLSLLHRQGRVSVSGYYIRRLRRLTPALLAMLGATLLAAGFICYEADLRSLGIQTLSVLFAASNLQMLRNAVDYWQPQAEAMPLLHTWSLSVEEQFYLLFPLVLIWVLRRAPSRVTQCLLGALGLSFFLMLGVSSGHPVASFYLLPTRAWELLAGAVLASWQLNRCGQPEPRWGRLFGGLGLCMVLISYLAPKIPGPAGGWIPIAFAVLGTFGVLQGARGGSGWAGKALSDPRLVGVGRMSYSLYLWHWPVIALYNYKIYPWPPSGWDRLVQATIFVILGVASYQWIENPIRRSRRIRTPWFLASLAGASLALAVASVVFKTSGYFRDHHQTILGIEARNLEKAASATDGGLRNGIAPELAAGLPLSSAVCLVGSSHGAMWSAPTILVARRMGWSAYSLCRNGVLGHFEIDNPEFNDLRRRYLSKLRPAAVLFADPWFMYLGHEERLRQTLRELLSYTQDLVLMDQPPFASQMVVDTPSLKLEVGENLLKAMNGALRQGHLRFQVIESDSDRLKREEGSRLLARVAGEFGPRIKIVATADLFQREASSVRVLDGNVPLYRDRSHLSDSGALVLTERLAGAMPVPHGLTLAK